MRNTTRQRLVDARADMAKHQRMLIAVMQEVRARDGALAFTLALAIGDLEACVARVRHLAARCRHEAQQ